MKNKSINDYIEDEETDLDLLKARLNSIKKKWIKFGLENEEKFLERYISLKEILIKDLEEK